MKLVLALIYNINLKNWDINYINKIAKNDNKYLKIVFFSYNIYKSKNQKQYNNFRILNFKYKYKNLKLHYYILIY